MHFEIFSKAIMDEHQFLNLDQLSTPAESRLMLKEKVLYVEVGTSLRGNKLLSVARLIKGTKDS